MKCSSSSPLPWQMQITSNFWTAVKSIFQVTLCCSLQSMRHNAASFFSPASTATRFLCHFLPLRMPFYVFTSSLAGIKRTIKPTNECVIRSRKRRARRRRRRREMKIHRILLIHWVNTGWLTFASDFHWKVNGNQQHQHKNANNFGWLWNFLTPFFSLFTRARTHTLICP